MKTETNIMTVSLKSIPDNITHTVQFQLTGIESPDDDAYTALLVIRRIKPEHEGLGTTEILDTCYATCSNEGEGVHTEVSYCSGSRSMYAFVRSLLANTPDYLYQQYCLRHNIECNRNVKLSYSKIAEYLIDLYM